VVELKYKDHCVGEGYPDLVVRLGQEKLVRRVESSWRDDGSGGGAATPKLLEDSQN
jgi:hypothetical protein